MTDYCNGKLEETRETVCVPVARYEKLILAERCMDTLAVQIVEDWSVAADNGYMEPTGFMKALLAVYNPDLYAATVSAVERIKEDNRAAAMNTKPSADGGAEQKAGSKAIPCKAVPCKAKPVQTDLF